MLTLDPPPIPIITDMSWFNSYLTRPKKLDKITNWIQGVASEQKLITLFFSEYDAFFIFSLLMQIYTLQAFVKHAISQPHTGLEQFTVKFGYFPPP